MNIFKKYLEEVRENKNYYYNLIDSIEKNKIRSSSQVEYDNQLAKWLFVAKDFGFDNLKDFAEDIVKNINLNDSSKYFDGMEGLAVLSNNQTLLQHCDYNNKNSDGLIVSYFYGGKRFRQWAKYCNINKDTFIQAFKNAYDYGTLSEYNIEILNINDNKITITFNQSNEDNMSNKQKLYKFFTSIEDSTNGKIKPIIREINKDKWIILIT